MAPALLPESSPSVRGGSEGGGESWRGMEKWMKGRGIDGDVRERREEEMGGEIEERCLERWWRDGEIDGGRDGCKGEGRGEKWMKRW